jgi:hypothetical protein
MFFGWRRISLELSGGTYLVARPSLGGEDANRLAETLRGFDSHPAKISHQPEASLAWGTVTTRADNRAGEASLADGLLGVDGQSGEEYALDLKESNKG